MRAARTIRFAVSAGLLAFLAWQVDFHAIGRVLHSADPAWAAAAVALGPVFISLLSFRLYFLLRSGGLPSPFVSIWRITWAGQFFNLFLPGSTGGDLFKLVQLWGAFPDRRKDITAAVVADRLFALVALVALAIVGGLLNPLPWFQRALSGRWQVPEALGLLAVTGAIALAILWWASGRWPRLRQLRLAAVHTLQQTGRYFAGGGVTWTQLAAAVAVHLINFAAIYCVARSLGAGLRYVDLVSFMPVLMLILLVPITVNGHGLRELVMVGYFAAVNATTGSSIDPSAAAVAFSLGLVGLDLITALPGGLWWLCHRGGNVSAPGKPVSATPHDA